MSALVPEFIENYEFGLAYEFIVEGLKEHDIRPNAEAIEGLRAAASIMGFEPPFLD